MNLYTIGFTKRSAEEFFNALEKHGIKRVIDVRLNNKSQLAGFTKGKDLAFFLRRVSGIDYEWWDFCAPPENLLKDYQNGRTEWLDYVQRYNQILADRNVLKLVDRKKLEMACLLCSEPTAEKCHRRLLADYLQKHMGDIDVVHL